MAEKSEDINKRVEEKTGFGTYILKDLISTGTILGGAAIGGGLGYAASRAPKVVSGIKNAIQWVVRRFSNQEAEKLTHELSDPKKAQNIATAILAGTGVVGGAFAGGVPHTYLHWREQKRQQYRVEEMAEDVIKLREQRNAVMANLNEQANAIGKQNGAIQRILDQGPKGAEHIKTRPSAPLDRIEQERSQPSEPKLG